MPREAVSQFSLVQYVFGHQMNRARQERTVSSWVQTEVRLGTGMLGV